MKERIKGYIEVSLGILLIAIGYFLYWWSTQLLWILIYPSPTEKLILDTFPCILFVTGGILLIDGIQRILGKKL